jgi:hypothetical protein
LRACGIVLVAKSHRACRRVQRQQPPIADVRSRSRLRRDLDAHTTLTQFIISHHI